MKRIDISKRDYKRISELLKAGYIADAVHNVLCMHHGLYYVKNHGKGKTWQKQKVEHLWRAILFTQYDTPELSAKLSKEELEQIKNYLQI